MLFIEVNAQLFNMCCTSVFVFHIDTDIFVKRNWVATRWQ